MREYWSDRMVEDHYRDLFMEEHGYDPLDPYMDVDFPDEYRYEEEENERWIKESVKQFKEGNVTAHELIEVEEEEEK